MFEKGIGSKKAFDSEEENILISSKIGFEAKKRN